MEGRERMLKAYDYNWMSRFCLLKCCKKAHIENKYFFNRWLEVSPGPEPSDILWENLGVTKCERVTRICIITIISLIFVILTSYVAVILEEIDPTESIEAPEGYNKHMKRFVSVILVVAIPLALIIINWLSEKVLEFVAKYEKRRSIS
jgi:hypothetical protein